MIFECELEFWFRDVQKSRMPILPLKYDMFYFVPLNSILWNIKTLRKEEWKEKGKQDMSNGGKKKKGKCIILYLWTTLTI